MGLARKLRKRADRFARVGKAKAAKRERKVEEKIAFTARHREKEVNVLEKQTWRDMQRTMDGVVDALKRIPRFHFDGRES